MTKVFAIGALGGSGTRVVAQILMEAGLYMGAEFSNENDNLLFTRLFRDPVWEAQSDRRQQFERITIFNKLMSGKTLFPLEAFSAFKAIKENLNYPTSSGQARQLLFEHYTKSNIQPAIWGWKEPNTHIYLEALHTSFPAFKYIHVLRHGLDMAFSKNLKQLNNWGAKFSIEIDGKETEDQLAIKQLDFWIAATKATLEYSKRMGENFYLLRHHNLYESVKVEIEQLFEFLEIATTKDQLDELSSLPKKPQSADLYKNHDLNIFREDQLLAVHELGFEI
jgi:hypothetical protein